MIRAGASNRRRGKPDAIRSSKPPFWTVCGRTRQLEQTAPAAMTLVRNGEAWTSDTFIGSDALLPLPGPGIEIVPSDLYADMALPIEDIEEDWER